MSSWAYDVAIVGAGLAGSAAATLLARHGLSVALVERSPDPRAHKVACTHFIQASATPTIERLGLTGAIEAAGAVRNSIEIWTRWGVIRPPAQPHGWGPCHGYSLSRSRLDPLVRANALASPGVDPVLGFWCADLEQRDDAVRLVVRSRAGEERTIDARLVVGADGRGSTIARLAGLAKQVRPNGRFAYWAYFHDLELPSGPHGRFWHLDPDIVYALPIEAGKTLVVAMPSRLRLPEFQADREAAFARVVQSAPGLSLGRARQVSPLRGQLDMPNIRRPAAGGRIVLIGDAALACDPAHGVGCGWALQSAEWLAEATGPALVARASLRGPLREYRRRHRAETRAHYNQIVRLAHARRLGVGERVMLTAAARDEELAGRVLALTQRRIRVAEYRSPGALFRAVRVLARAMLCRPSSRTAATGTARG